MDFDQMVREAINGAVAHIVEEAIKTRRYGDINPLEYYDQIARAIYTDVLDSSGISYSMVEAAVLNFTQSH